MLSSIVQLHHLDDGTINFCHPSAYTAPLEKGDEERGCRHPGYAGGGSMILHSSQQHAASGHLGVQAKMPPGLVDQQVEGPPQR